MRRSHSRAGVAVALVVAMAALSEAPSAVGTEVLDTRQVKASEYHSVVFPARPSIDNSLLPWTPGTQYVYDGVVVEDGETLTHQVVMTVTDLVKVVDGVTTRVLFDNDISEGVLKESELAFQAQDTDGTVWSLGEYPEEYEDGTFIGAPSTWLAGKQWARAGIMMQARPTVGAHNYAQGRAPVIDFADRAKVIASGQQVTVPAGCFTNVWVVDEWDALDPAGGHQLKYHAPGVGVVYIEAQGGTAQESLSLVRVEKLTAHEMAEVREQALRLDRRAYRHAPKVYTGTLPATRLP